MSYFLSIYISQTKSHKPITFATSASCLKFCLGIFSYFKVQFNHKMYLNFIFLKMLKKITAMFHKVLVIKIQLYFVLIDCLWKLVLIVMGFIHNKCCVISVQRLNFL